MKSHFQTLLGRRNKSRSEAQQMTGQLGVKYYFGVGRESGTKLRQIQNTRYDPKIMEVKVGHWDDGG